jgi:hypothetical protein
MTDYNLSASMGITHQELVESDGMHSKYSRYTFMNMRQVITSKHWKEIDINAFLNCKDIYLSIK